MQKTLALAAVALVALVAAPAAQADNPQITVPTGNISNITGAANGVVGAALLAQAAIQASVEDNAADAQTELVAGRPPTDQVGNIVDDTGTEAGTIPDAAAPAAFVIASNAGSIATDKLNETEDVANGAAGVANSGVRAASTVANAALRAACQQPLPAPPDEPVPCNTGSVQASAQAAAQGIADTATGLEVDTDPTEDAARDLLNGLVVGLGDAVLGP